MRWEQLAAWLIFILLRASIAAPPAIPRASVAFPTPVAARDANTFLFARFPHQVPDGRTSPALPRTTMGRSVQFRRRRNLSFARPWRTFGVSRSSCPRHRRTRKSSA